MARRMSSAQFRSKLRQAQAKQKQAIDKYNREVRAHNQKVKTAVNKYNQAINRYNSQVRSYNSRVRANRERLRRELNKLSRASFQSRYTTFRASVESVQHSYSRLESRFATSGYDDRYNEVLDLSEREAANSASVMNALLGNPENEEGQGYIHSSKIDDVLSAISADLLDRWHGALYSLDPRNPDAARHFCTSARDLLSRILNARAPDDLVLLELRDCQKTPKGKPTWRSKIRFLLQRSNMYDEALQDFVEKDVADVIQLFREFNEGTHGSPGRFNQQLTTIKKRIEDSITFLWDIIRKDLG
ncbi:MAG: hypothetical protein OXK73_13850 [Rhodospirillaceae bacterium]|nr:hypothetical protein [Rhodospirillaceae bacterium]